VVVVGGSHFDVRTGDQKLWAARGLGSPAGALRSPGPISPAPAARRPPPAARRAAGGQAQPQYRSNPWSMRASHQGRAGRVIMEA